jgi:hypothetical protein
LDLGIFKNNREIHAAVAENQKGILAGLEVRGAVGNEFA